MEKGLAWLSQHVRRAAGKKWPRWVLQVFARIANVASPKQPTSLGGAIEACRGRSVLVRTAVVYILTVLAGALLLIVRRVESALQQMHLAGGISGSALEFPLGVEVSARLRSASGGCRRARPGLVRRTATVDGRGTDGGSGHGRR
jgi:hypothetical protein